MADRKIKSSASKTVIAKATAPAAKPVLPVTETKKAAPPAGKAPASAKPKAPAPQPASAKPELPSEVVSAAAEKQATVKIEQPKAAAPAPAAKAAATPAPPLAQTSAPEPKRAFVEPEAKTETIVTPTQTKKETDKMTDQINQTIEQNKEAGRVAADRVQAAFGDINQRTKSAMERNARLMEEMTELTKGNVEAFVASSRVATKGFETLGQEAAEYGRRSFEQASTALKSFAEVKSPTDFFRLQSDYARSTFDSMVSESSKLSETVIKLAGEVAEPITSRYSVAAERVKNVAI